MFPYFLCVSNHLVRVERKADGSHVCPVLTVVHSCHRVERQPRPHQPSVGSQEPVNQSDVGRNRETPPQQFRAISRIGKAKDIITRQNGVRNGSLGKRSVIPKSCLS